MISAPALRSDGQAWTGNPGVLSDRTIGFLCAELRDDMFAKFLDNLCCGAFTILEVQDDVIYTDFLKCIQQGQKVVTSQSES